MKKKVVASILLYCRFLNGLVDKHYFLFLFFLPYTVKYKAQCILCYVRLTVHNHIFISKNHINILFTWVILFLISLFSSSLFFPVYFLILYGAGIQVHTHLIQLPTHRILVPFSVLGIFLSVLQFLFQNYTDLLKALWPKYHTCEMVCIL